MKHHIHLVMVFAVLCFVISHAAGMEEKKMAEFTISSPAFQHNGNIPGKYTCDGKNVNPPLTIHNVPSSSQSLVLIVDDPDAPGGVWVHWLVWNIRPSEREIRESSVPDGSVQGTNDFGITNYGGPCPPSGTHRYFFKLYALDAPLQVRPGAKKPDLEKAMKGHIIAESQITGLYRRK